MAKSTPVKKATRSLIWLLVIVAALAAANAGQALLSGCPKAVIAGSTWTPKLALDLEGGTEIILQPQVAAGHSAPTADQLNQAVSIIRQRIDASGVSEAEINTQGSQNVVVSIPGIPDQATINRIESSAKLEFRPVLVSDAAPTSSVGGTATPTPTPSDFDSLQSTPSTKPTNASDEAYVTPRLAAQFAAFTCDQVDSTNANVADPKKPLITCDDTSTYKYILGPVEVAGETISDATSGVVTNSQGISTGQWAVNIVFNAK